MIAFLKGQILKKTEKGVILKTDNIGYFISLPLNLLQNFKESDQAELFIHSHIREDAFDLYGFSTFSDHNFFKTLISVSGIGPKSALEILNNDTNKIKSAIINEDSGYLCKVPGIGQKTAKRIILELKNKIEIENISDPSATQKFDSEIHPDAFDALIRLGYQRHQITKTLKSLPGEITEAEKIITFFLKNI